MEHLKMYAVMVMLVLKGDLFIQRIESIWVQLDGIRLRVFNVSRCFNDKIPHVMIYSSI